MASISDLERLEGGILGEGGNHRRARHVVRLLKQLQESFGEGFSFFLGFFFIVARRIRMLSQKDVATLTRYRRHLIAQNHGEHTGARRTYHLARRAVVDHHNPAYYGEKEV